MLPTKFSNISLTTNYQEHPKIGDYIVTKMDKIVWTYGYSAAHHSQQCQQYFVQLLLFYHHASTLRCVQCIVFTATT